MHDGSPEQVREMSDEQGRPDERGQQGFGPRMDRGASTAVPATEDERRSSLCGAASPASHEADPQEVDEHDPSWPFLGSCWDEYYRLLVNVRRCVRYHDLCESYCEGFHRRTRAFATVMGSGVVAAILVGSGAAAGIWYEDVGLWLAVVAVAAQAVNIHFRFAERAWAHRAQRDAFGALEADMVTLECTQEQVKMWMRERSVIERQERPTKRVVNALAHNEVVRAMGLPASQEMVVTSVQAFFAPYVDIRPGRLRKRGTAP